MGVLLSVIGLGIRRWVKLLALQCLRLFLLKISPWVVVTVLGILARLVERFETVTPSSVDLSNNLKTKTFANPKMA